MAGSFLKYIDTPGGDRGDLNWHRAAIDGAPFRGNAPLMREEEFEAYAERVYDAKVDTFDMSDPERKAAYAEILDRASNRWYKILACDRKFVESKQNWLIYLEWVEPHMEIPAGKMNRVK